MPASTVSERVVDLKDALPPSSTTAAWKRRKRSELETRSVPSAVAETPTNCGGDRLALGDERMDSFVVPVDAGDDAGSDAMDESPR